ncbi:MAG: hypothetical protein ACFCUU_03965 [Cyclobacteriaceae bacterium]
MATPELVDKIIDQVNEGDLMDLQDLQNFLAKEGIEIEGSFIDADDDSIFSNEFLLDISMNQNLADTNICYYLLKLDDKRGLIYHSDYDSEGGTIVTTIEDYTSKDNLKKFVFEFLPANPVFFLDEVNDFTMGTMFNDADERRFETRFVVATDWSGREDAEEVWDTDELDIEDDLDTEDDNFEEDDDDYRF